MPRISVKINGKQYTADIDPRTLLLDFIRDHAGLTGSKRGCNEGKCGACTVMLDRLTVKSCNLLAMQGHNKEVLTIEGLATDGHLSPLQQCFHEKHSLQCGFCTAGFLLSAEAFLRAHPDPDDTEIREALAGNLCRCTGYQGIVDAVHSAARELREEGGAP